LPRIEEDGGSWLRRPKLYKRVVEPYKKKKKKNLTATDNWKNLASGFVTFDIQFTWICS
jgi:hypothetical protein